MICKLNLEIESIRKEVLALQKESYAVEAQLINYYEMPGLIDDDISILASNELFFGDRLMGNLVGIIGFKIKGKVLDIHRLAVSPSYFRRGIGEKLIRHIESLDSETEKIIVSTGKENYPACRCYEKLGFTKVRERKITEDLIINHYEKIR